MNYINKEIFEHHIKTFDSYFNLDSNAPYTLRKAVEKIVENINENAASYGLSLELSAEKPIKSMKSDNFNSIYYLIYLNARLSSGQEIKNIRAKIGYPRINEETGLFDSGGNYYTPVLRLLRKPCIKIVKNIEALNFIEEGPDVEKSLNENVDETVDSIIEPEDNPNCLIFKIIPETVPYINFKFEYGAGKDTGKLSIKSDDNFGEALESGYIDVSTPDYKNSSLFKLISTGKITGQKGKLIKFSLSAYLRNIINSLFGIDSKEDCLTESDINAISSVLKMHKDNLGSFKNFIEFHLQGLLSRHEAVGINEAFYQATIKNADCEELLEYLSNIENKSQFEIDKELTDQIKKIFTNASQEENKIYKLCGIELLSSTNTLDITAHQRKVTFIDSKSKKAFHSDSVAFAPKTVRDVNVSTIGRLCAVETPESQNLGLVAFLAYGAKFDPENCRILSVTKAGLTAYEDEEAEFLKKAKKIKNLKHLVFENKFDALEFEAEFFKWKESDDCPYKLATSESLLGYSALMIPFIQNTDAARTLMGAKNMKSALPLIEQEPPIIKTGYENKLFINGLNHEELCLKSPCKGKIIDFKVWGSKMHFTIKTDSGEKKVACDSYKINPSHSYMGFIPLKFKNDKVEVGDTLAVSQPFASYDNSLVPLGGRNLLVCFSPFEGYNFEDGIVISERLVSENVLTSLHAVKMIRYYDEKRKETVEKAVEQVKLKIGDEISKDEVVNLYYEIDKDENNEVKNLRLDGDEYSSSTYYGTIANVMDVIDTDNNRCEIHITFIQKRPIAIGDKLMGRYGNKGVVTKILPEKEMPKLLDGTPVDMILNPNGVISRMNIGQLFETQLSPLVKYEVIDDYSIGAPFSGSKLIKKLTDPSSGPENIEKLISGIKNSSGKKAKELNGRFDYSNDLKVTLYADSEKGEKFFEMPVVAGYQYFFKLNHLAEDKIHTRKEGSYSLMNRQPVKGRKRGGGQRVGEMEFWCLLARDAKKTIDFFLRSSSQEHISGKFDEKKLSNLEKANKEIDKLIGGADKKYKQEESFNFEIPTSIHTMLAFFKVLGIFIKPNYIDRGRKISGYEIKMINSKNAAKLFSEANDYICGFKGEAEIKRNVFENDNYADKKIDSSIILTDSNIYGNDYDFKKYGNEMYKKFGIIKFPYPIINPLFKDKLKIKLKSFISKLSDRKAVLKLNEAIDKALPLKNYAASEIEISDNENFDMLLNAFQSKGLDEACKYIESCRMDFLVIPPLVLRNEISIQQKITSTKYEKKLNFEYEIKSFKNKIKNALKKEKSISVEEEEIILANINSIFEEEINSKTRYDRALEKIRKIPGLKKYPDLIKLVDKNLIGARNEKIRSSSVKFELYLNKQYKKILDICLGKLNNGGNLYGAVRQLFYRDEKNKSGLLKMLATKHGFLRQNLLGRRVDYSARAVITPEPLLGLGEVIIPLSAAEKFFDDESFYKDYFIKGNKGLKPKTKVKKLNDIINKEKIERFVIFNRQPSLHRFSIQAFKVKEVTADEVIKMHPLSCKGLGADFDGDTAALYYYHLMGRKNDEKKERMIQRIMSAEFKTKLGIYSNLMSSIPAGESLISYEQDFKLGEYLIMKNTGSDKFKKLRDEFRAALLKIKDGANKIKSSGDLLVKLIDKLIDSVFSVDAKQLSKKADSDGIKFENVINDLLKYAVKSYYGDSKSKNHIFALEAIDAIKDATLKAATAQGVSFGIYDLAEIRKLKVEQKVSSNEIIKSIGNNFANGIALLLNSGSRGKIEQIEQLIDIRGRMNTIRSLEPQIPTSMEVKSGLFEGHSPYEYLTSIHGSRCGLGQKKLLTPVCGHFTRMLVEGLYDLAATADDCKASKFIMYDKKDIRKKLEDIVLKKKISGGQKEEKLGKIDEELKKILKLICMLRFNSKGQQITEDNFDEIYNNNEVFELRSPVYCQAPGGGVCRKCHGALLSTGKLPKEGERVGIIAAQTIGERGTQLAMKMFHDGGVFKEDTFGNAVVEVEKVLNENKSRKLNAAESYKNIFSVVLEKYIQTNKLSAVYFEMLCRAMLGNDGKVKYTHSNAGLKETRDFLSRSSYSGLAVQTSKLVWELVESKSGSIVYDASNISEKTNMLFSATSVDIENSNDNEVGEE